MPFFRQVVVFLIILARVALGKVLYEPSHIAHLEYDFIVVGGGTAGNVVANRLSEEVSVRVLVIEAGLSNQNVEDSIVPFFCPLFYPASSWTWNYTTVPQSALGGREIPYPSGRLLGGSSSINSMIYTRGSSEDFDRYARITGDPGWSWSAMEPYLRMLEQFVPSADGHNTTGQFDRSVHGFSGPLRVSLPGYHQEIDDKVVDTTRELDDFPFNEDMNSGFMLGIGWTQATIGGSERSSSATAYLSSKYLKRENLDILLQTSVTKLVPGPTTQDGHIHFTSVELARHGTDTRYYVSARKEIILSAGAINTPQLLMLSGVGDPVALRRLGIDVLLDHPDVGRNLQDHPLLPNQFLVNSTNTFESFERNATLFGELFVQYNTSGTGPFVDGLANLLGWFRIPPNSSIFGEFPDPSAGPNSAHYEMTFSNGFAGFVQALPDTGNYMTIMTNVVAPMSRGFVTLNSIDPFDSPLINPGLLDHPFDVFVMVEAIKAVRRFLNASAWSGYTIAPYGEAAIANTDEELVKYARNLTTTVFHPVGTARMSSTDAEGGVVNPDLSVKRTEGLRIIDASVFAAVYAFAERGADLIKKGVESIDIRRAISTCIAKGVEAHTDIQAQGHHGCGQHPRCTPPYTHHKGPYGQGKRHGDTTGAWHYDGYGPPILHTITFLVLKILGMYGGEDDKRTENLGDEDRMSQRTTAIFSTVRGVQT
ncbi:hypothetical protein EW146_g7933 [Bondarzewia mesenterica]|uniref:Glucose-methanol-choline oxidoreductase N-terminal domain-containing protein n=1 Tax=Bondarzewia mesenterica TaxID=1095465 RepID=A0A4S4LK51_9AGAM|nr:hypothetical protein EW146_g7933 [Bondarzewia mesenterica]